MKILIVGAGALGCWLGATLYTNGLDVSLYHYRAEKVRHLQEHGVKISQSDGSQITVQMPVFAVPEDIGQVDLVLLLVKSQDTASAAQHILRLNSEPDIISLQNGLGQMQSLAECFPKERLFNGVIYQGAQETAPGEVLYAGSGRTIIAAEDAQRQPAAEAYAELISSHGIPMEAVELTLLERERWQKLLVNAALNPVSALSGLTNGESVQHEPSLAQMQAIAKEGMAVANSLGLGFDWQECWQKIIDACLFTAPNKSSMLVDIERGRNSEIDAINGAIVRIGQQNGIPTPINEMMIAKIKALSAKPQTR